MSERREPRQVQSLPEPAAEPPAPSDGLSALVRSLLPERSEADRAAGIIRVALGPGKRRKTYELPVLSIKQNRAWKATFQQEMGGLLDALGKQADGKSVLEFLNGLTDQQVACVRAYDIENVLPDLEDNATEAQLLTTFLGVVAAAYPFAEAVIGALQESRDLRGALRLEFWRSMSSSQPSTDGAVAASRPN